MRGAEKKPSLGTKHLIKHNVHGKVCLLADLSFPARFRNEQSIPLTATAQVAFS